MQLRLGDAEAFIADDSGEQRLTRCWCMGQRVIDQTF